MEANHCYKCKSVVSMSFTNTNGLTVHACCGEHLSDLVLDLMKEIKCPSCEYIDTDKPLGSGKYSGKLFEFKPPRYKCTRCGHEFLYQPTRQQNKNRKRKENRSEDNRRARDC